MSEKLIVTLWRGQLNQLDLQATTQQIICRLKYAKQSRRSKPADTKKGLVWKQTYIFALKEADIIKLDFIRLQEGQKIHYAEGQVAQTMAFGHSNVQINVKTPTKGTMPAKADIIDDQGRSVGKIFLEYQVLKTEVTYIVEKQMDYMYMMKVTAFKVQFLRNLKRVPNFYLKIKTGERQYKEDFAFDQQEGFFIYNYPVKLYLKKETEMVIQLDVRDFYGKDYYGDDSYKTESMRSDQGKTVDSGSKKNSLDIANQKITAIMDLTFKKNVKVNKKLPLTVPVRRGKREIGSIEFQIETFFKTKQELNQLEEQLKAVKIQKDVSKQQPIVEKKKKYQPPKNGVINVNSIITKIQPFNEQTVDKKDFSLQIKLGKQIQRSTTLQNPGRQLIFIETYAFKRTWEETMKFILNIHSYTGQRLPTFYAEVSLRDLFEVGRYLAKRLPVKDQARNYCGEMIVDISYVQEIKEKKERSIIQDSYDRSPVKTVEEVLKEKRDLKRKQIVERMRKKQLQKQERKKNRMSLDESSIPHFSEHQLLLPPIRSRNHSPTTATNSHSTSTISPRSKRHLHMFNKGGSISFSKSRRFDSEKEHPDSYFYNGASDFDFKHAKEKGAFIGYGERSDFTKNIALNPGAGRYAIPSLWDKYKQ